MSLINWSDDLSVRVQEIDEQHKKLIHMINTLHDAMKAGQAKQTLEKTLQDLAGYAVYHFQTEEKYMQQFKFSGFQPHKLKHDAFVKKVTVFQEDYRTGKLGLSLEVMNFLRDWITTHIKETDKHYSETFRQAGLR